MLRVEPLGEIIDHYNQEFHLPFSRRERAHDVDSPLPWTLSRWSANNIMLELLCWKGTFLRSGFQKFLCEFPLAHDLPQGGQASKERFGKTSFVLYVHLDSVPSDLHPYLLSFSFVNLEVSREEESIDWSPPPVRLGNLANRVLVAYGGLIQYL